MQINEVFDARNFEPDTGGSGLDFVPEGTYNVVIENTEIKETKNKDGGMFVITYKIASDAFAGKKVAQRLNLWNKSDDAKAIAQKQLSAVCHVTGIFQVPMAAQGAALRGAALQVIVKVRDGDNGAKYSDVVGVLDVHGNKPGQHAQAAQPAPAPVAAPAPQHHFAPAGSPNPGPSYVAPAPAAFPPFAGTQQAPAPQPQAAPVPGWQQAPVQAPVQAEAPIAQAPQPAAAPQWSQSPAAPAAPSWAGPVQG